MHPKGGASSVQGCPSDVIGLEVDDRRQGFHPEGVGYLSPGQRPGCFHPEGVGCLSPGQRPGYFHPEGVGNLSPGQRPGYTGCAFTFQEPQRGEIGRLPRRGSFALSGLDPWFRRGPRALPWAEVSHPFGMKTESPAAVRGIGSHELECPSHLSDDGIAELNRRKATTQSSHTLSKTESELSKETKQWLRQSM